MSQKIKVYTCGRGVYRVFVLGTIFPIKEGYITLRPHCASVSFKDVKGLISGIECFTSLRSYSKSSFFREVSFGKDYNQVLKTLKENGHV